MHFGLGERDAQTKNGAAPIGCDPHGDEQRAAHHDAVHSHVLVAGIEQYLGNFAPFLLTVGPQVCVEGLDCSARLAAGGFQTAQLLHHGRDLARRHTLDVHFRSGRLQGSFAPSPCPILFEQMRARFS